jgi:hypothetical protein
MRGLRKAWNLHTEKPSPGNKPGIPGQPHFGDPKKLPVETTIPTLNRDLKVLVDDHLLIKSGIA